MTPVLYPANETAFTSNGLGRLSGAISCNVREAINGAYELVMVYPIDGIHYEDIAEGRYIYAAHDDSGVKEPFEIFEISRPFDGKVEIHAWHWSYRLNKVTVLPHVSSSAQAAVQDIKNYAANDCPFTFSTDVSSTSQQTVKVPTSARSIMGGVEGSVIDIYGGEWEFIGSRCILRSQRGTDSGVTIKYGKNLTDAKKTTSTENVWTGIIPYYTDGDNCVFYNGIIYSSAKDDYAYTMVIPVDASTSFESAPTQAQLRTWGTAYVKSNAKTSLPTSIDISFVQLWQTEEYADVAPLQRLYIGDTVTIQYKKLGISNKARIVEYDYNVLLERYDSMTVGNVRADFASTVQGDIVHSTTQMSSKFAAELQRATNAITGVSGGAFVINTDANGHPYETLWMNTDDKKTATRVIRINYEGIAMGSGYNGPFNSAWLSMDGTFDAQNINVIHLDAGSIETGLLQSANGKVKFDVDAGTLTLGNKALIITAGNLILKANGDAIFSGELKAASGTFAGKLEAATGTFAGNLSAAGGTFKGDLSAAGGTFKGQLSAATGSFSGAVTATSGKIGPWNITSTSIWYGDSRYNNANSLYFGTNGLSIKDKFRVGSDGTLVATGVTITGTIRASKGYIGGTSGFTIDSLKIYNGKTAFGDTAHSGIYIGTDGISVGLFRGGSASGTGVRISNSGLLETGGIRFFTGNGLNTARYGLWAKNGGTHIGSGGPLDFNSEGSGIDNNPNILRNGTILYGGARISGGLGLGGDVVAWGRNTYNLYDVDEIQAEGTISTSADGYFGGGVKAHGLNMDNTRIVNSPDITDLWEAIGTLQQRVSNLGG